MDSRYEQSRERFESDTENHVMAVIHDDGLYRHIRFQKLGTMIYYYDLVTWPGHLCITGDCGTYVFARAVDMLKFFELDNGRINPQYWQEKLKAPGPESARRFDPDAFTERAKAWLETLDPDRERPGFEHILDWHPMSMVEAVAAVQDQRFWEDAELRVWDERFLWCCWAIVRGIARYRELTTTVVSA